MADPAEWVAYAYWGHVPSLGIPFLAEAGVASFIRYHRVELYRYASDSAGLLYRTARCFPWRAKTLGVSHSLLISQHGHDYLRSEYPDIAASRLHISRLGVPDRGTRPARDYGAPLTIASCSNIVPVKQVHLIAQLAVALAKDRSVHWHHFGDGDRSLVEAALASAPDTLEAKLHGRRSNADVIEFYRSNWIDLFVNLSLSEGVPVSIMEAISFGIPTLATAVDGTPEVVENGASGMLVTPELARDPVALANKLLAALAPDGPIARSDPRQVWSRRYDARANYMALAKLLSNDIATKTVAQIH